MEILNIVCTNTTDVASQNYRQHMIEQKILEFLNNVILVVVIVECSTVGIPYFHKGYDCIQSDST